MTWNYAYDNANHLTQATEISGGSTVLTLDYGYDAFGNLIQETSLQNSTTTITKYAEDGWNPANQGGPGLSNYNYWAVLNSTNGLQTREIMSIGTSAGAESTPLGRIDLVSGTTYAAYLTLTDRQDSVVNVLSSTQNATPVDTIGWDAWGNAITQTNGNYLGQYGFDGYDYDAEAKLYILKQPMISMEI